MINLLTQNSKMKKSSSDGLTVVNWTLPAFQSSDGFRTCPNAGACAAGCYARSGTYRFKGTIAAHESKLSLAKTDAFVNQMIHSIDAWLSKRSVGTLLVRIHDAGDFFNHEYLNRWLSIMDFFSDDSRVSFYAYTKQVLMFKEYKQEGLLPEKFHVVYSFGGLQDDLIDTTKDSHAKVFSSDELVESEGYTNGTYSDLVAGLGQTLKIGLVYHGAKNYSNTAWSKVGIQ